MRIISIDFGEKRIGLAYVDTSSVLIAQPVQILANDGSEITKLKEFCESKKIDQIVLGYPRNMLGEPTQQTRVVEEFGDKLKSTVGLPLIYQDETLSTAHVKDQLSEDKKGTKTRIDDQAAALILQDYIEQHVR